MEHYKTLDWLNLRSQPRVAEGNVLGIMPPDTIVEKIRNGTGTWYYIKTKLGRDVVDGFASGKYLEPTSEDGLEESRPEIIVPKVHLNSAGKNVNRNDIDWRAYPLNEPGLPVIDLGSITEEEKRVASIHKLIYYLDVENKLRYAPTIKSTFCNIYTYDIAYCLNCYLPHVWWTSLATSSIEQGEKVKPIYGKTIIELNANATTDWLENQSQLYGWKRMFNLTALQDSVNQGNLGLIAAQRINLNEAGHIVAVVPETENVNSRRDNNRVLSPLQSQAGRNNRKYFTGNWWENPKKYRKFGYWVNEG